MMPWKCHLGGLQFSFGFRLALQEKFDFSIVKKRFFIEMHPEYLIWAVDQLEGV